MSTPSHSLLGERGLTAASVAPVLIRSELDTERYARTFLASFEVALKAGRRDALRLYCELLEMVGGADRTLELALRALGVTLDVARQAIAMHQSVDGLDRAALLEQARLLLVEDGWVCVAPGDAAASGLHSASAGGPCGESNPESGA
jgi:hypothetical protein